MSNNENINYADNLMLNKCLMNYNKFVDQPVSDSDRKTRLWANINETFLMIAYVTSPMYKKIARATEKHSDYYK